MIWRDAWMHHCQEPFAQAPIDCISSLIQNNASLLMSNIFTLLKAGFYFCSNTADLIIHCSSSVLTTAMRQEIASSQKMGKRSRKLNRFWTTSSIMLRSVVDSPLVSRLGRYRIGIIRSTIIQNAVF